MGVSLKRSLDLLPLLPIPQGVWTKDLGYLKEEIVEERRRAVEEGREELIDYASDREVLMVLCEASMNAPIRSEYVEIYQYLMTRVFGDRVPEDLRKENLSDYEKQLLMDMKRRIRDKQWRALEKAMKGLRKGQKRKKEATTGVLF